MILILLVCALLSCIQGQTVKWIDPISDNWNKGERWSVKRPPCASEIAYLPKGSSSDGYEVQVDDVYIINGIELEKNAGILLELGSGFELTRQGAEVESGSCLTLNVQVVTLSPTLIKLKWDQLDQNENNTEIEVVSSDGWTSSTSNNYMFVPVPMDTKITINVTATYQSNSITEQVDYFFNSFGTTGRWKAPEDGDYDDSTKWENNVVPCADDHVIASEMMQGDSEYTISIGSGETVQMSSLTIPDGPMMIELGVNSKIELFGVNSKPDCTSTTPSLKQVSIKPIAPTSVMVKWDEYIGSSDNEITIIVEHDIIPTRTISMKPPETQRIFIPDLIDEQTYTISVFIVEPSVNRITSRHEQIQVELTMPAKIVWNNDESAPYTDVDNWYFRGSPISRLPCSNEHIEFQHSAQNDQSVDVLVDNHAQVRSITFLEPGVFLTLEPNVKIEFTRPSDESSSCPLPNVPTTPLPITTTLPASTTTSLVTTQTTTTTTTTTQTTSFTTTTLPNGVMETSILTSMDPNLFDTSGINKFESVVADAINDEIDPFIVDDVTYTSIVSAGSRRRETESILTFRILSSTTDINNDGQSAFEAAYCALFKITSPARTNEMSTRLSARFKQTFEMTMISVRGCENCVCTDQQECPDGTILLDGDCVEVVDDVDLCLPGETELSNGACQDADGNIFYRACRDGAIDQIKVNGKISCIYPAVCLSDSLIFDADIGACIPRSTNCPAGQVKNIHGDCVQEYVFCGIGRQYNVDALNPLDRCEPIDQCTDGTHKCDPLATCIETDDFYDCQCPDGFSGDGRSESSGCSHPVCTPNPCQFDGVCVPLSSSEFRCDCSSIYSGDRCQLDLRGCNGNPCQNGGSCVPGLANLDPNEPSAFSCLCEDGYEGNTCATLAQATGAEDNTVMYAGIGGAVGFLLLLIILILILVVRRGKDRLDLKKYQNDVFEIDRKRVRLAEKLGSGAFGEVFRAFLRPLPSEIDKGEREVAAKLLKPGAPVEEKKDFLSEIDLMKQLGPHPNVVGIIGHCMGQEPFMLLVELAEKGNLRDFLRDARKTASHPQLLHMPDFIDFSIQIANGMAFLEANNVVHRDLACRNVLVGKGNNLKISDFGLARDVEGEEYVKKQSGGKLPIKWMAPESLRDRVYSSKSDVWSYGVTMWEIFSLGGSPYPELQNQQVLSYIEKGQRMNRPARATTPYYNVMLKCWDLDPDRRPSFSEVFDILNNLQRGKQVELESNDIDEDIYDAIDPTDRDSNVLHSVQKSQVVGDWMETNMDDVAYDSMEGSSGYLAPHSGTNSQYDSIYDNNNQTYETISAGPGTYETPMPGQRTSSKVKSSSLYELANSGTGRSQGRPANENVYELASGQNDDDLTEMPGFTDIDDFTGQSDLSDADLSLGYIPVEHEPRRVTVQSRSQVKPVEIYDLGDLGSVQNQRRSGQNPNVGNMQMPSEAIYELAGVDDDLDA